MIASQRPITASHLSREFGRKHFDFLNTWRLGQQLIGMRHQGRGDASIEMSLAPDFIGERIEDAECGGAKAQGKPDRGLRFSVGERQGAFQKCLQGVRFAWFSFEAHKQR
ncbi:hypothetical protein MPC4_340051 [Methylocella tundrae]|uniref:Uncharacterized protein n=1 Tax=Methylocella tundrae TaxID=227605 RepID=A0A8B6M8T5_METTU|nr:hypothetical protein MPC1_600005 [Methylocella tundrae]VTZ51294.1 hypothetical protein MPC4_340051 [Methylocella tundrae]